MQHNQRIPTTSEEVWREMADSMHSINVVRHKPCCVLTSRIKSVRKIGLIGLLLLLRDSLLVILFKQNGLKNVYLFFYETKNLKAAGDFPSDPPL